MSIQATPPQIIELIEAIADPRCPKRNFKHPLASIIFTALVGALCGANEWCSVVSVGESLKDWIKGFVPLPNGIPSHDTFGRVFSLVCPKAFNELLMKWMGILRESVPNEVISFDGKSLRGTADKGIGIKALHIVNAWSHENGICIGQLKVDDKSNEITAIPQLIEFLALKNCIVTCDALNTQKTIAKKIQDAGADYVLPVKENHPGLLEDIKLMFDDAILHDFKGIDADHYNTTEKSHGRIETRIHHVIDADDLPDRTLWKGLKSLGLVIRERKVGDKVSQEAVYYLLSLDIDARQFAKIIRGHWGIENNLHWCLDVFFREDHSRYRDRIGAENLSVLRKVTLAVLKKDESKKLSIVSKRLTFATDPGYRETILRKYF